MAFESYLVENVPLWTDLLLLPPRQGVIAYVQETGLYYAYWHDNTWQPIEIRATEEKGTSTLGMGGAIRVFNSKVKTDSTFALTYSVINGTPGFLCVNPSSIIENLSFVIVSTSSNDLSTVKWRFI